MYMKIKVLLLSALTMLIITVAIADEEVYSWKSSSGTTVLSDKKPLQANIEYQTIKVQKPSVVETHKDVNDKVAKNVKISQSDLAKLATSDLSAKNEDALGVDSQTINVTITSPSNGTSIFSKEEYIQIKTNPTLTSEDTPLFYVNGQITTGVFDNGIWEIPRPKPGKNKIKIEGKTKDGKDIISTNTPSFNIHNGWLQQTKNTAR